MGVCPQKFGPYFWGALHLACLYADNYKTLKEFVYSYTEVLPCPACREHFAQVLAQRPFPVEGNNLEYFAWSVDVHNIVSLSLKKPPMSYDDAFAEWVSGCDGNGPDDKFADLKIRIGTLIILGLIVVLIMKNR
jgi:Erv1 / Alr family